MGGWMVLSDDEISKLISLAKTVTNPRARLVDKRGSSQVNYEAEAETGERFRVYVRQNLRIKEAFSCGLLFLAPSGESVTLARYNGSDHPHSNPLDSTVKMEPAFHIHRATERYMQAGRKAEHFAQETDRYVNLHGALEALLKDCNISGLFDDNEDDKQMDLL